MSGRYGDEYSNPNPCPACATFKWRGAPDKGYFTTWNKEKKEDRIMPLPVKFLFLDSLSCVNGWSESNKSSIFSNEVKKLSEPLILKIFKDGKVAKFMDGLYSENKAKFNDAGAAFHTSIFCLIKANAEVEDYTLVRLMIKGAALGAWIDKGFDERDGLVTILEAEDKQKGVVKYRQPVFGYEESTDEEDEAKAKEAYQKVQDWYNYDKNGITDPQPTMKEIKEQFKEKPEVDEDLPF